VARIDGRLPTGDEKAFAVREMFNRIAPRYDLLNRLFTFGLDQRWRQRALDLVGVGPRDCVVDLGCGTGDLVELSLARGAEVVGVDFAAHMLRCARERNPDARLLQCDAPKLPLASGSANVVTCGFALRNFVSLPPVFDEMARVLVPGGRIALLEVDRPRSAFVRFGHSLYFARIVPFLGGLLSDRHASSYLPRSTAYLPPEYELLAMIAKSGFRSVRRQDLLLGTAQLVTAVRSDDS
jgi:demethylmenaquinone methyltransferase/2-methoxy-6-polyprenyl-1,4-benzoquinol methylase